MPPRKFKKYARSNSPARPQQNDDPSPSEQYSDFNFLIGALTSRILEKGLMDNKFLKNFFLNREDLKKNKQEQLQIVEKKISLCLTFPKKIQNQPTIRLIEEFAKDKGFTIENSIKYQQYEILNKPIIFQPTVFVTKEENWFDIFEQFKSENLKIVPNQNLQEFNNLIKNQQLTTVEKLQYILKQRFMIHNASQFPDDNPIIGNEDSEGNLQFLIDENLIPHRIIFKNKDEYDLIKWFAETKQKKDLNVFYQKWDKYIRNVQILRDKNNIQGKDRKIIQLNNSMQIEQEKPNSITTQLQIATQKQVQQNVVKSDNQRVQQQQSQQTTQQSNQAFLQSISQKSQQQQQQNQQFQNLVEEKIKEIKNQNMYYETKLNDEEAERINKLTMDELAQQVIQDLGLSYDPQDVQLQLKQEEKMLITFQFPLEVKNINQVKVIDKDFDKQLSQGFIYLNNEELAKLDQEVKNSLYNINFTKRVIVARNKNYTLSSPFIVQTTLMPLNMARQWTFFKNKQHVKVYIMQSQSNWIFQQLSLDPQNFKQAQEYLQNTYQLYAEKWATIIKGNLNIWKKSSLELLQEKAQELSIELIKNSGDQDDSHYTIKLVEDVWFTYSGIKQFILVNNVYDVKQSILMYVMIGQDVYEYSIGVSQFLFCLKNNNLGIQQSPIFEPTFSHDVICWLCYKTWVSWESFYVHKCNDSQAKQSFKQDHLNSWKLYKSK